MYDFKDMFDLAKRVSKYFKAKFELDLVCIKIASLPLTHVIPIGKECYETSNDITKRYFIMSKVSIHLLCTSI